MSNNFSMITDGVEITTSVAAASEGYSGSIIFLSIWLRAIITVIGLISNMISLLIIVKSNLKESSVGVYLGALSISDFLCLIANGLIEFPYYIFGNDWMTKSNAFCKLLMIYIYIVQNVSSWIIVTLTCERCYVIARPYAMITNNVLRKRAFKSIIVIILIAFLLYLHFAITAKVESYPITVSGEIINYDYMCVFAKEFEYFGYSIFSWIDLTVYSGLPFVIITSCNVIIITYVAKSVRNKHIKGSRSRKTDPNSKLTVMLLTNSSFFLITTLPLAIYVNFAPLYWYDDPNQAFSFNDIHYTIFLILNSLNYNCNLFIYILSGNKFRYEAKRLFCNLKQVEMTSVSVSTIVE